MSVSFDVEFPYVHSTGESLGRFFDGLRERVIWGRNCERCALVAVPARDYCDTCGGDLGEWREVGPEGTVRGLTLVYAEMPLSGLAPPFAFVRVLLDGAGTELIHLGNADLSVGDRVRPVWAAEPAGTIRDIARFESTQ